MLLPLLFLAGCSTSSVETGQDLRRNEEFWAVAPPLETRREFNGWPQFQTDSEIEAAYLPSNLADAEVGLWYRVDLVQIPCVGDGHHILLGVAGDDVWFAPNPLQGDVRWPGREVTGTYLDGVRTAFAGYVRVLDTDTVFYSPDLDREFTRLEFNPGAECDLD